MLSIVSDTGSASITTRRAVRASLVGLLLLFLVGCQASVERPDVLVDDAAALTDIPVEGVMASGEGGSELGAFRGALTLTSLTYQDGLRVSGVLTETSRSGAAALEESFENVPATLSFSSTSLSSKRGAEAGAGSGVRTASGSGGHPRGCEVLYLELGPFVFDGELGRLHVSLVEISLDLGMPETGTLGALLCTLTGFLEAETDLEVPEGVIESVVAQINALLDKTLSYVNP